LIISAVRRDTRHGETSSGAYRSATVATEAASSPPTTTNDGAIEEVWDLGAKVARALRGMKLSLGLTRKTGMFTDTNGYVHIDEQHVFAQPRFYKYPLDFVRAVRKAIYPR
jgi:hypothetical protein